MWCKEHSTGNRSSRAHVRYPKASQCSLQIYTGLRDKSRITPGQLKIKRNCPAISVIIRCLHQSTRINTTRKRSHPRDRNFPPTITLRCTAARHWRWQWNDGWCSRRGARHRAPVRIRWLPSSALSEDDRQHRDPSSASGCRPVGCRRPSDPSRDFQPAVSILPCHATHIRCVSVFQPFYI